MSSARRLARALLLLSLAFSTNAHAWECADWGKWFANRCVGAKEAWDNGDWNLMLPAYTWHAPWDYNNRDTQNAYPLGVGFARSVDRDRNTDMLLAMGFADSHNKPMYVAGYGYLYNWGDQRSFHSGIGFSAVFFARSESNYIPIPALAPIGGVSYANFSVMGTYLPFINVAMFWAQMKFN